MATKKQKEELMATLKFTPRKYRVDIWGYGGEVYWGRVDREIYDLFKSKNIDIEQYAGSWDDDGMWADIPDDKRPFYPGSPYDIAGVHESGCTLDESSVIVVSDEMGNEVWRSTLSYNDLESKGVEVECTSEDYLNEYDDGTVVFYGGQGEKGTFFGGEFELHAPFDPKLLKINYQCLDGWDLVWGVDYNTEEIESNDYDTTGKWAENKWIIIGDTEEVYEGIERDEEDYEDTSDDDEEITLDEDWFDKDIIPDAEGEYEVMVDAAWPNSGMVDATYIGGFWERDGEVIKIHKWRVKA